MHQELKMFLTGLAHDLDKLTAYVSDPARALEEAGLSEEDKAILRSGDQNRIYSAIANPAPSPQPEPPAAAQAPPPAPPYPVYGQPAVPSPAAAAGPAWGQYVQGAPQAYAWPTFPAWQLPQILYTVIPWPGRHPLLRRYRLLPARRAPSRQLRVGRAVHYPAP